MSKKKRKEYRVEAYNHTTGMVELCAPTFYDRWMADKTAKMMKDLGADKVKVVCLTKEEE